jgi:hypothetical protein
MGLVPAMQSNGPHQVKASVFKGLLYQVFMGCDA